MGFSSKAAARTMSFSILIQFFPSSKLARWRDEIHVSHPKSSSLLNEIKLSRDLYASPKAFLFSVINSPTFTRAGSYFFLSAILVISIVIMHHGALIYFTIRNILRSRSETEFEKEFEKDHKN